MNSFTSTSLVLHIYSNTSAIITTLGYRYMAITLKDSSNFGWIHKTVVQSISMPPVSPGSHCAGINFTVCLGQQRNLSFPGSNIYVLAFLGYDISAPSFKINLGINLV